MHCALQHWTCMLCSNFVLCSTENDNNKSCKRQKARLSRTAESSFFFPRRDVGNLGPTDQQASLNQLDQQAGHQPDQPARKKNKGPASWSVPSFLKLLWNRVGILWCTSCSSLISCSLISFFSQCFVFFLFGIFCFFSVVLIQHSPLCSSSARVLLQHACFFSTCASTARRFFSVGRHANKVGHAYAVWFS